MKIPHEKPLFFVVFLDYFWIGHKNWKKEPGYDYRSSFGKKNRYYRGKS